MGVFPVQVSISRYANDVNRLLENMSDEASQAISATDPSTTAAAAKQVVEVGDR